MEKEIIQFTKELTAIRSQNGIDSEKEKAKLVCSKLNSFGLEPKIIGLKEHPSVICSIKKSGAKKTIWLESCLDTAPVGDTKKWRYNPFKATIIDNKMYGRGVADCNAGIAIFCYSAKELSKDKKFAASIFLGFDADEQSGNFSGIQDIIKHAPKADLFINGYQGHREISVGARGFLRFKLSVFGQQAHTGSKHKYGINAIHKAIVAIDKIKKLKLKKNEQHFEYGSTVNVVKINGGFAINIVPDSCEVVFDLRLLPSQDNNKVYTQIKSLLKKLKKKDPEFDYKLDLIISQPGFLTDPNNGFARILKMEAEKVFKTSIPLVTSGQGSAAALVAKLGIPVINAFGVESGNVHSPDEWINITDIEKIYSIYKNAILQR